MIVLVWLFGAFVLFGLLGAAWGSRAMRPYVGLFGIALLIATAGLILGAIEPEMTSVLTGLAKWLAVGTAVAACVHGILKIIASMIDRASD